MSRVLDACGTEVSPPRIWAVFSAVGPASTGDGPDTQTRALGRFAEANRAEILDVCMRNAFCARAPGLTNCASYAIPGTMFAKTRFAAVRL